MTNVEQQTMKTNQRITTASLMLSAALMLGTSIAQADPTLRSLQIGAQNPNVAAAGSLAYYPLSITRSGTGSMLVHMTVTGLPAGCTYSFLPPVLSFSDQSPSTKNAQLVIGTQASTPQGTYPLTISASHGNSANVVTVSATLIIGPTDAAVVVPTLNVPVTQADKTVLLSGNGTGNQPYLLQACNDLSTSVWVTIHVGMAGMDGVFSAIDQDATNYPARFYRAAQ